MKGTLRLFLTLCIAVLSMTLVQAQERTYSGTVRSAGDNQVIIGANVQVDGTTQGTSTGVDGKYTIRTRVGSKLVFSYLGMKSQTITMGNTLEVNVTLDADATDIEDVVVLAFGSAKKKDLTGSVSSIDSKIISQQTNVSVSRALEGAIPGVQLATSAWGGQPGEDQRIIIRGIGTADINNANALIVIDGVPNTQSNALTTVNPKDIESMTVLKDAASTSLYGSRGANGVVMITTKKGALGKPKITFEGRWGANMVGTTYDVKRDMKTQHEEAWKSMYNFARYNNPKVASEFTLNIANPNMTPEQAAQYASDNLFKTVNGQTLRNWRHYNVPDGGYVVGLDGKLNKSAQLLWADNWQDEMFSTSFRQEYNLSVSGATDKTDYYISAGYQSDPSFINESSFDRYTIRMNLNTQVTKWLKAGLNMSYVRRDRQQPNTRYGANAGGSAENLLYWTYSNSPLASIYARNEDGQYIDKNGQVTTNKADRVFDLGSGQTLSPYGATSRPGAGRNPVYFMHHDFSNQVYDDITARGYLEAKFLKDFTFTANMSMDQSHEFNNRYQNKVQSPFNSADQGILRQGMGNFIGLNSQQLLNWSHDYGKHHIDAVVGHEYYWEQSRSVYHGRYLSLIDDMAEMGNFVGDIGTGKTPYGGNTASVDKFALEGYFARANYNYNNKYYFAASVRGDGSSKFKDPDKRWGVFWSVSGAWRISAEDWMEGASSWMNDLKLRASYGTMGNQNGLGKYDGYTTWSLANAGTLAAPRMALNFGKYGNPNLSWEKVASFDVGADFRFWDRFYGSVDFYVRNTTDMIWDRPVAISLGVATLKENSAHMRNVGFEWDMGVDIIRNQDWLWSFNVNGFHNTNKLISIPPGVGSEKLNGNFEANHILGGLFYLRGPGKDYYNIYLPKYLGVDPNAGLPLYQHTVTDADHTAGRYTDKTVGSYVGTTDPSQANRYEYGSATPDVVGGFGTSVRWKNLDLSVQFAFQIGGLYLNKDYADNFYAGLNSIGVVIPSERIGNTWTPDNLGAYFPMQIAGLGNFSAGSATADWSYTQMSMWDASYLSVKNITLGYNFPQKWMDRWGIGGIRVYASVDNMWLISAHRGVDPRMDMQGGQGVGAYQYPQMRSMSLGINVTF